MLCNSASCVGVEAFDNDELICDTIHFREHFA
jgi:hypothetical protein